MIDDVIKRLDNGNKWHKGGLYDRSDPTRVCVMGALNEVSQWQCGVARYERRSELALLLTDVVVERYPDRVDATNGAVASFNDHPATTWEDMMLVLKEARERECAA